MREVTLTHYLIIGIMTLVNIGVLLYTLIIDMPKCFIFLTHWSFFASTVYLCFVFFCDSAIYWYSSGKYDKINDYIRNTYSRYCFSCGYSVTFFYWLLVCLGSNFMAFETTPTKMFMHIYLHGIITIMLLVDLILIPHQGFSWSNFDFLIVSIAFLIYCFIVMIAKYGFGVNAYILMEQAPFWMLLLYSLGLYALQVLFYLFHIWVIKVRNNHCYQIKESNETKELILATEMQA